MTEYRDPITGFLVRSGVLLNKEFRLKPLYGDAAEEFTSFLIQYYEEHPSARELVVPRELDISALQAVLDMPLFQPQKMPKPLTGQQPKLLRKLPRKQFRKHPQTHRPPQQRLRPEPELTPYILRQTYP